VKILVLGAGAVGGYFGGRMAQAGADVTFLVRPKRAERLASEGLHIRSRAGDLALTVRCVTQDQVKPEYDLAVLTAKAYDLDSAIAAIAPGLRPDGVVLPLLNGMAHLARLEAHFGHDRVLGGVAYIAATLKPDGVILHLSDFHRLVFGPRSPAQRAACEAFSGALAGAGFDWQRRDDVEQAMWDKWVLLASLAGMTCLMRATVGDIMETEAGARLTLALLGECAAIARAAGFPTPEDVMANYRAMLTQKGSAFTASMLRDIEAGGPTEGDHILGALLAQAKARRVPAPVLEVAATHLAAFDARRRRESVTPQPASPVPSAGAR
jgi:2-dehydropantoate 2-reductase